MINLFKKNSKQNYISFDKNKILANVNLNILDIQNICKKNISDKKFKLLIELNENNNFKNKNNFYNLVKYFILNNQDIKDNPENILKNLDDDFVKLLKNNDIIVNNSEILDESIFISLAKLSNLQILAIYLTCLSLSENNIIIINNIDIGTKNSKLWYKAFNKAKLNNIIIINNNSYKNYDNIIDNVIFKTEDKNNLLYTKSSFLYYDPEHKLINLETLQNNISEIINEILMLDKANKVDISKNILQIWVKKDIELKNELKDLFKNKNWNISKISEIKSDLNTAIKCYKSNNSHAS